MNLFPYESSDLGSFLVAGKTWRDWQHYYQSIGISSRENLWISAGDLNKLQSAGNAAALSLGGESVAFLGDASGCGCSEVQASEESFFIHYVWDLLKVNEQVVSNQKVSTIKGDVHSLAVIDGEVRVGEGSRILPGVYIEGNVVIGENCKIGPNCYIRGNTSIGDSCHIGQSVEIKNSMIGNGTNVGHLSYVGDSILGHGVNLGAGTVISNFRHDGGNHSSMIEGELIDTERRKFGAVLADGVHTGINTSIYPGRKLGKDVTTAPLEVIKYDK